VKTSCSGIYVIHRPHDSEIAKILIGNLARWTQGKTPIYTSSNINKEDRKIGRNLRSEIRERLTSSNLLILIFTKIDDDWLYCMWELALAARHAPDEQNIFIFQLGSDLPVFLDRHQKVFLDNGSLINFADNIHKKHPNFLSLSDKAWYQAVNEEDIYLRGTILFEFLEEYTSATPPRFTPFKSYSHLFPNSCEVSGVSRRV